MREKLLRRAVGVAAFTLLAGSAVAVSGTAHAATSGVSPVVARAAGSVTADALPTVQIDGVVWSQAIVGGTVYAGGKFTNARPAGAAAGTDETPRNNLLSYNLSTGTLNVGFAPSLNGQVKAVAASPNGSRVYVGGSFTTADGVNRYRLAAYSTSTGALIKSFAPVLDATVNALTVTNTTVYAGGVFSSANGVARTRLAAFDATDGALLGWAPTADNTVDAVQLTPDDTHVIVGGAFENVNGAQALGLASVKASTGASSAFATNQVVKDYGSAGAILSLSTDGTSIYGTGYAYGSPSNFEGVFSADPTTGTINWLADCHGDSYGAFGTGSQVYVVSHEHFCANVGGFPDTNPRTRYFRSTAFTTRATGTVQTNGETGPGYGNFAGQPSPSLTSWYPTIDTGTFTGQSQGAWTVTGNSKYVVEGGEFLHVNGTAQQGLVRFAISSLAPDERGPQDTSASTAPTVTVSHGAADVSWPANWDQDNGTLTYALYRDDNLSTPRHTIRAISQPWNRPTLTFHDTGMVAGKKYIYWVRATDASGNTVRTANTTVLGT